MRTEKLLVVFVFLGVMYSCSSDENNSNGDNTNQNPGFEYFASSSNYFWKDFVTLCNAEELYDTGLPVTDLYGFAVSGNDIYQGAEARFRTVYSGNDHYLNFGGCVLKNNTILYSDTGEGTAVRYVAVKGSDVYYLSMHMSEVTGQPVAPKLWKNGVMQYELIGPYNGNWSTANPWTFDLCVVGTDVYVGGWQSNGGSSFTTQCGYWKNGNFIQVTYGQDPAVFAKSKLKVTENGDVYFMTGFSVGGLRYQSKIFKNGVEFPITYEGVRSVFFDFDISGTDLYIVGTDIDESNNSTKTIWKNGTPIYFSFPENNYEEMTKISISDNRVFTGSYSSYNMTIWELNPAAGSLAKVGSKSEPYGVGLTQLYVRKK
ncbi:hypothetical protein [Flavobacterium caeni]|uniref:Uncharacterized protein n=1 Tax=Flavobacterium caeni TaxID=490189 RepID=A0A1G5JFZ1_9FLAO|nr:hypothetical protein [Flavobacterium caeni]SCY87276.1 hypothetical protein SAMN02927903_02686 [Flavobacterium caeni]